MYKPFVFCSIDSPNDIKWHFSERYDVHTWYSKTHGDINNEYLRQYASKQYAIHIGTWYTLDSLDKCIESGYSKEWTDALKIAKEEIFRRIFIVKDKTFPKLC